MDKLRFLIEDYLEKRYYILWSFGAKIQSKHKCKATKLIIGSHDCFGCGHFLGCDIDEKGKFICCGVKC